MGFRAIGPNLIDGPCSENDRLTNPAPFVGSVAFPQADPFGNRFINWEAVRLPGPLGVGCVDRWGSEIFDADG